MDSRFTDIEAATPIEVFALIQGFGEDKHPDKVNLSVGAYRDDDGKPWVLPVVRAVEAQMATDATLNHEYLKVAGIPDYRDAANKLLLGENCDAIVENRVDGVQALGGTGAIRIAADFLKSRMGMDTVYVSSPTWGNHKGIFKSVGFSQIKEYRYWNEATKGLDLDGMLEDLRNAPDNSVVILHAVAHNPTGVDPTEEQWKQIADVCEERKMFVLMDCAYQGFATGNLNADAAAPRYFLKRGFEFFVAQSFSKNFGLYNERVGNLCIICKSADAKARVFSQLELVVRTTWSNPPNHGGRIVATILNNDALKTEWKDHVELMSKRILKMREFLYHKLRAQCTPGKWNHIIEQKGMFSYTGLNKQQVDVLLKKYHIYLMKSGRINMCGLTTKNIDYVAKAIHTVVINQEEQQQQQQQGRL